MIKKNIKITPRQKKLSRKTGDLILERVFMKIEANLNDVQRQEMGTVFDSQDDSQKASFIKKYAPNFGELLKEETIKTVREIKDKLSKK